MMSTNMFKSLDFGNANTIKNLAEPTQSGDAARLIEINDLDSNLTQALNIATTQEAQNRGSAISTLRSDLLAEIVTVQSAYQAADNTLQASLTNRINELSSGFAVREPVYAILTTPVTLQGLAVNTPSFSGVLPDGARVLTNAQGGDLNTAHVDNRVWIAQSGAWTPASDLDDGTSIDRALLVTIQNGSDEYNDSVVILVDPISPYTDAVLGITALRWARWQSVDRVLADDTSLVRNGTVMSVKLDPNDLVVGGDGITVTPQLKALLRDLSNATGSLPVDQVSGLLAYLATITLNHFAAAASNVSLGGFKVTNLADPGLPTDAVNLQTLNALQLPVAQVVGLLSYISAISLSQLTAPTADLSLDDFKITNLAAPVEPSDAVNYSTLTTAIAGVQSVISGSKYAADLTDKTVVDGDSVYTVTHNFGSRDFMETVYDKTTGETVSTDFFRIVTNEDLNTCKIVFKNQAAITDGQYRILLSKIA